MGRPENDSPLTSNWPLYSLASWLRIQRKEAGLTYPRWPTRPRRAHAL